MLAWLSRFLDVRRGELRPLTQSFAMLLLIIAGHTVLETARDALLLMRFPPGAIGVVYVAVAACALPAAALAARAAVRFGARRTLVGGLVVAAASLVALHVAPTGRVGVVVVYVTSALVGAVLVPLFWSLVGSMFTVAEGRRLLGPIGGAGVVGGALGSLAAAAILVVTHVKDLLLVSAGVFVVAAAVLASTQAGEAPVEPTPKSSRRFLGSTTAIRTDPFLGRIALLVVASTAAMVIVDYYFKWTVAQTVPHEHVARLVARYYAVLNGLSLVVQLFVSGALVRRIGVANAMLVTPLLVLGGGAGALALGGVLAAVLDPARRGGDPGQLGPPRHDGARLPAGAEDRSRALEAVHRRRGGAGDPGGRGHPAARAREHALAVRVAPRRAGRGVRRRVARGGRDDPRALPGPLAPRRGERLDPAARGRGTRGP